MRKLVLGTSVAVCLTLVLGIAQASRTDATPALHHGGAVSPAPDSPRRYFLRLQGAPAATYAGGVAGYAATSPHARSERMLDVRGAASYAAYLDDKQSSLLKQGGRMLGHALAVRYRYHFALNGMSVMLTPAEARRMTSLPGVLSVQAVEYFAPAGSVGMPASSADTNASRAWVGAPLLWQLPTHAGTDNEGEGIVLAELDTGINHANSAFAATGTLDGYVARDPGNLRLGVCDPGNHAQHSLSTPLTCNDKLIGAYSYTHGSTDPDSPEDSEGHGSHTASTAVGDFVSVPVNGMNTPLSGVAPHASLIVYDVCAPTGSSDFCAGDDDAAAVEQAIQDQATLRAAWGSAFKGMVLNYSILGSDDPYGNPVDLAFLNAAEAGIYVSVAGGNGGPANIVANDPVNDPVYHVEHLGAWVATMAATTHDGSFTSNRLKGFSGGDSATRPTGAMAGDGITAGFASQPLVYTGDGSFDGDEAACGAEPSGEACASMGSAATDAQLCIFPFAPGTFNAGEIVVCDRRVNALVDKAYNVQQGGAAAMVIATTSTSSQDMVVESYVIPATLLMLSDGDKLRAWLSASAGSVTPPSAGLSGSHLTTDRSQADQIAGFSSREPVDSPFDSLIKPDMAAPGVSVLAAVSNPLYTHGCSSCNDQPETYDFFEGTSMAAPHDTGAAALLKQAHPDWTPAEIKSVLMLTAVTSGMIDQCQELDASSNCIAGDSVPTPQVRGSGRVDIDAAQRSGLMLDEDGAHYQAADPAKGGDLTALNLASLANAACAATCTWTRTVTSTFSSASVDYKVSVSGRSSGLGVSVSPGSFTLAPHQIQVITVTANTDDIAAAAWAFAEVDLKASGSGDGGAAIPEMHMPIAVKSTGAFTSGGKGTGTGTGTGSTAGKSSGGGGGDMGLFGLATLLLALRRRNTNSEF